jgi:diguanylate cyclase (GGDEF)-like protein
MVIQALDAPLVPVLQAPRTGATRLRGEPWAVFLAVGLGLALVAAVADADAVKLLQVALGSSVSLAILIGVWMHHPARRWPWQLLAACMALTTVGEIVIPADGGLAVFGTLLATLGGVIGVIGFAMLIRGRIPGGDRAALLDAAIFATGTGVLISAFGFAPLGLGARQASLAAAAYFYPCVVALGMVARMWFLHGAHRQTTRLIVMAVISANAIILFRLVGGPVGPGSLSGPSAVALVALFAFVGAAALHPSMAIRAERQDVQLRPVGRGRIVALAAALLVNPATLAIQSVLGRDVDPGPHFIAGALIGLLVVARLGDTMRQLRASLHERESLMERLRHQALYDDLTSLPNRSLFNQRIEAAFADPVHEAVLAVLMIDLDGFKQVNDVYGHAAGDALLVAVGQRLRAIIGAGDTAARLGGDEFVIVMPGCADTGVAVAVGELVLARLGQPFEFRGQMLSVRASVGVAVAGPAERTADDLVRSADVAMYAAKSQGQGRLEVFEPSMLTTAVSQLRRRTDLAAGIVGRGRPSRRSAGGRGPLLRPH